MRLKQIKLAGFKSFVDVTTVPFPDDMTAIVGPNGCGKSNIIDAVRWVLGESSAKNLRGDSMTDVIFNGSTGRKPVGQASIELVFNNIENRLQGSMADRTEISIRRVVNRDSQNTYFLNGSKCRRKDITDIFLGTGLGPRSYAIIEQGMISKLIESKPQELRTFIEEAAGVSKYKERRRETENRIRHTRDNLERLADIRTELTGQIEKLHGQSEAAIRFRKLKKQERTLKAELTALKWQKWQNKLTKLEQKQLVIKRDIEQSIAKQTQAERESVEARQLQLATNDELSKIQNKKLALTTNITRLEQNIRHAKQQKLQLSNDLQKLTKSSKESEQLLLEHQHKQQELTELIAELEPQKLSLLTQIESVEQAILDCQHRQSAWQQHWDKYQKQAAEHEQQVSLNNANLESTRALMKKSEQSILALKQQLDTINVEPTKQQEQALLQSIAEGKEQCVEMEVQVEQKQREFEFQQNELEQLDSDILELQTAVQQATTQYQTLAELLSSNAGWQKSLLSELTENGVTSANTFASQLDIESGWELAAEMVLGQWLQAIVVNNKKHLLLNSKGMQVCIEAGINNKEPLKNTLAEKVKNSGPFTDILNDVLICRDVSKILTMQASLAPGQSVICKQGEWLGLNWRRNGLLNEDANEHSHTLKRQSQFKQLGPQIELDKIALDKLKSEHETSKQKVALTNNELKDFIHNLQSKQAEVQLAMQQQQLLNQKVSLLSSQLVSLNEELQSNETTYQQELDKYQVYLQKKSTFTADTLSNVDNNQLLADKESLERESLSLQQQKQQVVEQSHQLNVSYETNKTKLNALVTAVNRELAQHNVILQQQQDLKEKLKDNNQPIAEQEQQLQALLNESSTFEQSQQHINNELAKTNEIIESFNKTQHTINQTLSSNKEQLSLIQIDAENYKVRANTALEQLAELQQNIEDVMASIPEQASESQWQVKLARTSKEISNLGAINLAAIDEFKIQSERKEFLDAQNNDLESALATLESAIAKIDKETRHKFKETFDQVNKDLKILFPKVFGGGSAYLDLTGDDLLETGVTIMARPPGKKNSTIHLLSGGEKALTALSLVFAIFRLNPAPFCMLDEVDAPLDDANVGRFCNLVEEMSKTVQFIYISHNKVAMEMASHLTGVTMHEPGVSRMVAVDIDEAVAMAEVV